MMCKTNLDGSNYCDNVLNSPEAGHRDNTETTQIPTVYGVTAYVRFVWGICQVQSH